MRDFERQSHALQTDWTNKRDILRKFLQPKKISSSSRYETLLFQRKPNPPCLLPTIPPACQPLLTLNTGFWASRRDARFLRLHRWQLVFTPIAFTAWGRRDGGRRREEMERRRINGHGKDRRADRKTGRRKERWWVHHCLARLWLGTYLWRTWCGCRERERGGKRGFGNHHLGDQRPVCLFRLQPFSSVWTKGIGYWKGGGGLRQAAESKNYFSSLTLLSSYICPDAVSLIINNLLSDSWHACKESTNRLTNTLHTHAHARTQKDGGLQENHGVNEAAVTHKSPGESVMWPWSVWLTQTTLANRLRHRLQHSLQFILSFSLLHTRKDKGLPLLNLKEGLKGKKKRIIDIFSVIFRTSKKLFSAKSFSLDFDSSKPLLSMGLQPPAHF